MSLLCVDKVHFSLSLTHTGGAMGRYVDDCYIKPFDMVYSVLIFS